MDKNKALTAAERIIGLEYETHVLQDMLVKLRLELTAAKDRIKELEAERNLYRSTLQSILDHNAGNPNKVLIDAKQAPLRDIAKAALDQKE